ncbi:hypothetical protein [Streptomyces sp. NPDC020965]|uniref:hypothetical protein n=1 Tax=Streptomyces sp. NPDC020965 TaxID=3365105 RepID=UPI003796601F
MSFDQEWVSARTTIEDGAHTRLNQVEPGGGKGGEGIDLSVSQDKLGELGSAAFALHSMLSVDGRHADASTGESATLMTVNGFQTGAAMSAMRKTWDSQLKTLLDACANISNHLDYSAASHGKQEKKIEAALRTSQISDYLT